MSMKRRGGYIAAISREHITMTTLKSQWICSKHFVYIVYQSSFHLDQLCTIMASVTMTSFLMKLDHAMKRVYNT